MLVTIIRKAFDARIIFKYIALESSILIKHIEKVSAEKLIDLIERLAPVAIFGRIFAVTTGASMTKFDWLRRTCTADTGVLLNNENRDIHNRCEYISY